jgi:hypothetical protein
MLQGGGNKKRPPELNRVALVGGGWWWWVYNLLQLPYCIMPEIARQYGSGTKKGRKLTNPNK